MAEVDITKDGDGGVLKKIIKEGEGTETPHAGCEVKVHYTGTLLDGTKFDSSKDRNEPFVFPLMKGRVIEAWDLGVASMKKGEVCVLTCAPKYAYGAAGAPPKIPPNATLQFEIEMISWEDEDLSPKKDGSILRHIIEQGTGTDHAENSTVTVELEGRLKDSGKVFDSRTVTFILGEGGDIDVCDGIERALESFQKGEKSRLTIQPKYAFKSKGNETLGVPPNAVVEYIVTLKDFEKAKGVFSMTDDEKLEQAKIHQERGSNYFKAEKYTMAIKKYNLIIEMLNDGETDSYGYVFTSDENKKKAKGLIQIAHLNLALVYLKVTPPLHFKAIEHANKALAFDPKNVKGLFRRGQALLGTGDANKAIQDFEAVLKIEPNNKAAANMIRSCRLAIQKQREKEKQLYSNMFDKFAKHDNEVEKQRARQEEDVMGSRVGEWGAAEWTDRQRDRKPTDFERENPNILMLDKDGQFQNM